MEEVKNVKSASWLIGCRKAHRQRDEDSATISESLIEVMSEPIVNLLKDGGVQMSKDDIKKAKWLGISYGEYMALKKDFYSNNAEKALNATIRMAELMEKAGFKIKRVKPK